MPNDKSKIVNPDLGNIEEEQQSTAHISEKLKDQIDNPLTGIADGDESTGKTDASQGNKSGDQPVNPELGDLEENQQNESLNEGEGRILLSGFDENE